MKVLLVGVLIYLIWALLHHKKDKSLTFAIFIEYLLTAFLSIVLVMGVLL